MFRFRIAAAAMIAATLSGCDQGTPPAPQARPVRTITIERGAEGETVSLTGQVRAKDQTNLAFRLDGRMIERPVNVGDMVTAGQVVGPARPADPAECAAFGASEPRVRSGAADPGATDLRAAAGALEGWLDAPAPSSTRPSRPLLTAQAQVDSAQAQVRIAQELAGLHGLVGRCRRVRLPRSAPSRARWSVPGRWLCSSRARADATPSSTCRSSSCGRARATRWSRSPSPTTRR